MTEIEIIINKTAQDKIDFKDSVKVILQHPEFDFPQTFQSLETYILNAIPNKSTYDSETYRKAIQTIPLKPTLTPIVILNKNSTKIAFRKLKDLPKDEEEKIITSLLWIFKVTDSERRNTDCKNGCGHFWHNLE
ncbi:hypothetical protein J2X97_003116 [Epilithonimonas hungarica]|uniref:DUF5958 family protein n=1 Tax=Epilithonimonas hungarica TaxID=454006 RepID=UPI00278636B8|nr:DUF5958 family protein [Epilithonimonas hungarica]MDP9957447.1 hypothetical protein [Epilithonimonas hungarica]